MPPHSPSPVSGHRHRASILWHAKRDQGEPLVGEVMGLPRLAACSRDPDSLPECVKRLKLSPQKVHLSLLERESGRPKIHTPCLAQFWVDLTVWLLQFIVRNGSKRRLKSKLYLFNSAGLVCTYVIVLTLNFVHRIFRLENGRCIIGARRAVLVPLVSCDVLVNIYLTTLFLIPLRDLNASTGMLRTSANVRLRSIAIRTFIGSCCTATSSIITAPLLFCPRSLSPHPQTEVQILIMPTTRQVLFSALVIQWVTRRDDVNDTCSSSGSCTDYHRAEALGGGCCCVSEAGPSSPSYDATGRRRSSAATTTPWCCRRPSDGTTRAASLMMRRDSLASVHNGKPLLLGHNNNPASNDYHVAVASAGPIHWENIFSLFAHDDRYDRQQNPREVTPGTLDPITTTTTTTPAAAPVEDVGGGVPEMAAATDTARSVGAATTDAVSPLQRPKPSRTLSSIRSIRSIVTREPSQMELAQSPAGEEDCAVENGRQ
ncbi:hypothetical protein PG994_001965 [Apiospora phragmitis]|uniref:Integral membrane protein n=1 Tax=Apiospora phragmitis TaxID=2905665 RepID=A0ABR1WV00_9PEZI